MHKKGDQIIQIILFNQKSFRREYFREEFENGNTRILICIDAAKIGANIQDMARTI